MFGLIIALTSITVIPMIVGLIFALPSLIPAFHGRAKQSSGFRKSLIILSSIITLILCFGGMTYASAISVKILPSISSMGQTYFNGDAERNAMLTRELWFREMIPPWMQSDSICVTGDSAVCEASQELWNFASVSNNRTTGYIRLLIFVLIASATCGYAVYYLTRDHRKEKQKIE